MLQNLKDIDEKLYIEEYPTKIPSFGKKCSFYTPYFTYGIDHVILKVKFSSIPKDINYKKYWIYNLFKKIDLIVQDHKFFNIDPALLLQHFDSPKIIDFYSNKKNCIYYMIDFKKILIKYEKYYNLFFYKTKINFTFSDIKDIIIQDIKEKTDLPKLKKVILLVKYFNQQNLESNLNKIYKLNWQSIYWNKNIFKTIPNNILKFSLSLNSCEITKILLKYNSEIKNNKISNYLLQIYGKNLFFRISSNEIKLENNKYEWLVNLLLKKDDHIELIIWLDNNLINPIDFDCYFEIKNDFCKNSIKKLIVI